jgi:Na+/melibiose symporter-like transporter
VALNFDQLISLIQATIAPDVLISGCALLCLVIQTRYGRVVDRMRTFNQEHFDLRRSKSSSQYGPEHEKRIEEIRTEVAMLVKRGNYLKLSLFGLFTGILSFILTSFLIFSAYLLNADEIYPVTIVTFSVGLLLVIVGVLYAIVEVFTSYAAVVHEIESEQY